MAYPSASVFSTLAQVYDGVKDLIPHIEEAALRFVTFSRVLPGRVRVFGDMPGSWNVRKFSKYQRPRRAIQKGEAQDFTAATIRRKRFTEVEPQEWADSYQISDRRIGTDLENVVSDAVEFLGTSLGFRQEKLLFKQLLSSAYGTTGTGAAALTLADHIAPQQEVAKQGWAGQWYMVIHPYQEIAIKQDLLDLTKPAVPAFRDRFISQWQLGGFGNLILMSSPLLPRYITYKLNITAGAGTGADGDTFKLRVGEKEDGSEAITAAITVDATDAPAIAATIASIETALNGIADFVDGWDVTGSALNDITITPPTTYYVDVEDEMYIYKDADGDIDGTISEGDILLTERTGKAKAIMWTPDTALLDVRTPLSAGVDNFEKQGYLDLWMKQTYGVADLEAERRFHIHTLATSPYATP